MAIKFKSPAHFDYLSADTIEGVPAVPGKTWYVDSNSGNDGYDGKSWPKAKKTLAAALALAHAYTSSAAIGWASRSVIFYKGDNNTEVLTKFADKTDVVGVGSTDLLTYPKIVGAQAPTSCYTGTRFINMGFANPSGVLMTIPTGASGISFIGCQFDAGATTTTGILATASTDLTIKACSFKGSWSGGFSTAAISLATGSANRTIIDSNWIENNVVGILVNAGRTGGGSYISNNKLFCSTICIDENSDTFVVIGNRGVSGAAAGDTACDIPARLSVDNIFNSSDIYQAYPIFPDDKFQVVT